MDELERLPTAHNPRSAEDVLRIARGRKVRRRVAAGAVGVALLALAVPRESTRPRGIGGAPLVGIEAAAEGPGGVRPLADGGEIGPDERVVFRVTAGGPGALTVEEQGGERIWPPSGAWAVQAGAHWLGDPPMAWTPDHPGRATVVAELCDDAGACERASFTVSSAP